MIDTFDEIMWIVFALWYFKSTRHSPVNYHHQNNEKRPSLRANGELDVLCSTLFYLLMVWMFYYILECFTMEINNIVTRCSNT